MFIIMKYNWEPFGGLTSIIQVLVIKLLAKKYKNIIFFKPSSYQWILKPVLQFPQNY